MTTVPSPWQHVTLLSLFARGIAKLSRSYAWRFSTLRGSGGLPPENIRLHGVTSGGLRGVETGGFWNRLRERKLLLFFRSNMLLRVVSTAKPSIMQVFQNLSYWYRNGKNSTKSVNTSTTWQISEQFSLEQKLKIRHHV